MKSRCGCPQLPLTMGRVGALKLASLLFAILSTAGCTGLNPGNLPGVTYDKVNRGASGQFLVAGTKGSGHVALPTEVKWGEGDPDYDPVVEPIAEWTYRYKWVGADGKMHFSEWKSLGFNPNGSAVCDLTVRPSEVPELGENWDRCVCQTRARHKSLNRQEERTQDLPFTVWAVPAAGSP